MLAVVQLEQLLQTETRCHVAYVILDTIEPAAVLVTTVVNVEKKKKKMKILQISFSWCQ